MNFMKALGLQKSNQGKQSTVRQVRKLLMEPLEERQMLAVTAADFDTIRSAYPDLNLSANMSDYNVIEITPDKLTDASLRQAIATAGTTVANDLIVVRTTATQNSITISEALTIDIDAEQHGSVTLVGFGDQKLTIDADQKSGGMQLGNDNEMYRTKVSLAGLTIMNANSHGIFASHSDLIMTDLILQDNRGDLVGAGMYAVGSNLKLTNSTIRNNESTNWGTGLFLRNTDATLINTSITNNKGVYGAGIYVERSKANISFATIANNVAAYNEGGGIFNDTNSTLTMTNSIIVNNSAFFGGGIYNSGTLMVANCTIVNNLAEYHGIRVSSSCRDPAAVT